MWKLLLFICLLAISTSPTNCQFGQDFSVFGSRPFTFPPSQRTNLNQPDQNYGNIQQQENTFSTQNNGNLQRAFSSPSNTQPGPSTRFQNNFQTPSTYQDFGSSRNLQRNDHFQNRLTNTQNQPAQNFRQENVSPSHTPGNFAPTLNNEYRQNQNNVQQQNFYQNQQSSIYFPNNLRYQPNYASTSTSTASPKPNVGHRRTQIRLSINENNLDSDENLPEEESGEISNSIESRFSRSQSHKGETTMTLKINFTLIFSFQNAENSKKC